MSVLKIGMGRFFAKYIQENMSILFLILIVFIIGITAGVFTVNTLNSTQKSELYTYINGFLESKNTSISQGELFEQIFLNYSKLILTIWFLGVTVIGIPLIYGVIGFKGFTIGFTVGFMLDVFTGFRGIMIVVSSIIPQTLIILPCIIIISISGIKLSMFLLKGSEIKKSKGNETKLRLVSHTAVSVLVIAIIALGALLETLIQPMFLSIIKS